MTLQEEKFITDSECAKCSKGFYTMFNIVLDKIKTLHYMIIGIYGIIITALGVVAWEYLKR